MSCSWLLCFHSLKNIEVGSLNPRLISSNFLRICSIQTLGPSHKFGVGWVHYSVDDEIMRLCDV